MLTAATCSRTSLSKTGRSFHTSSSVIRYAASCPAYPSLSLFNSQWPLTPNLHLAPSIQRLQRSVGHHHIQQNVRKHTRHPLQASCRPRRSEAVHTAHLHLHLSTSRPVQTLHRLLGAYPLHLIASLSSHPGNNPSHKQTSRSRVALASSKMPEEVFMLRRLCAVETRCGVGDGRGL